MKNGGVGGGGDQRLQALETGEGALHLAFPGFLFGGKATHDRGATSSQGCGCRCSSRHPGESGHLPRADGEDALVGLNDHRRWLSGGGAMWRGFWGGKHPCVATRAPVGCVRAPRRTVAEHALPLTGYPFGWRLDMGSDNPGVPQSRILASARHQ